MTQEVHQMRVMKILMAAARAGVTAGVALGQVAPAAIPQPQTPAGVPAQPGTGAQPAKTTAPPSTAEVAERAGAYLRSVQHESGGWSVNENGPTFPAITALVLQGLSAQPGASGKDPAIAKGVEFLLSKQQPDGGIYDRILPSYNTAISLTALCMIPEPSERVVEAIKKAQAYLVGLQYGEDAVAGEGGEAARVVSKDDPFYGGWGYGNRGRPDLSNTAFAVEALRASGLPDGHAAYQRALVFLQRCQMLEKNPAGEVVNDMPYARGSTQGGFVYATSVNKDEVGVGQSFAGEIAESLSGPPGFAAVVTLGAQPDGKPGTLTRAQIQQRVTEKGGERVKDGVMVVLGAGMAGDAAGAFEVRAATDSAETLEAIVREALADAPGGVAGVKVRAVSAWKGESRLRSYGTMTYSGLKSYLYAGLDRKDPRVLAAAKWIAHNYTLNENPGLGTDGMYYYFLVFSRSLAAYGFEVVPARIDGNDWPQRRYWKEDLTKRLAELQEPDGSFRVVDDRWMEDNTVLITAYGLVALQYAR
jgi:hypothetical protein